MRIKTHIWILEVYTGPRKKFQPFSAEIYFSRTEARHQLQRFKQACRGYRFRVVKYHKA